MQTCLPHLVLGLTLAVAAGSACGDHPFGGGKGHHEWEDDDHSYDRARRASERGEILSLEEIYARVATQVPGRVLETELEHEHGGWVYELKILDPQGRLQDVSLDARTGLVLPERHD